VEAIKSLRLTVLVRNNHQAQVLSDKGIASTVLEGGLDDTEGLSKLASEHDIVVHGATGFHKPSALALIQGLSKRKQERADDISPVYIHVSSLLVRLHPHSDQHPHINIPAIWDNKSLRRRCIRPGREIANFLR
jgi:hypothetical protein